MGRNKVILIKSFAFQVSRKVKLNFLLSLKKDEKRFVAHYSSVENYVESLESYSKIQLL